MSGFWSDLKTGRWVMVPGRSSSLFPHQSAYFLAASSLRILLLPVFLHINWIVFTPLISSHPPPSPFAPLLFISYPTPSPTDDSTDPRYRRGWLDLVFLAYYGFFFSFVPQSVLFKICYPISPRIAIHKRHNLRRFGEQA